MSFRAERRPGRWRRARGGRSRRLAGGRNWKEMAGRRSATGHRRRRRERGRRQRLEGCEEASKERTERQLAEGSNGDWKEMAGRRPAADLQSDDGMPPRRSRKEKAGIEGASGNRDILQAMKALGSVSIRHMVSWHLSGDGDNSSNRNSFRDRDSSHDKNSSGKTSATQACLTCTCEPHRCGGCPQFGYTGTGYLPPMQIQAVSLRPMFCRKAAGVLFFVCGGGGRAV